MTQLRCGKCGQLKPKTEFSKNKASRTGYHNYCKQCVYEYNNTPRQREIRRKCGLRGLRKKKKFILSLLGKYKCEKCSESELVTLDFHHIKGREESRDFRIIKLPYRKIIKYMQKNKDNLMVLCSNCHRKEHAKVI